MPKRRYPLEAGGPDRLVISYGWTRWSKVAVQLDGQTLASFSVGDLSKGKDVPLPEGSYLRLSRESLRFGDLGTGVLDVLMGGLVGSLRTPQILHFGPSSSGVGRLIAVIQVAPPPKVVTYYAYGFAALGSLVGIGGTILGIFTLIGSNSGQSNPVALGAAIIVGSLALCSIFWLLGRGLWRLRSWARNLALLIIALTELLGLFSLLVNFDVASLVAMVAAAVPAFQLLLSDDFTANAPAKERMRATETVDHQVSNPRPAIAGPTREQFQRQVEAALSLETRSRLQIRFTDQDELSGDPARAWFPANGAWGWIQCHDFDPAAGASAQWEVNVPGGHKTVIPANESALLEAIKL